MFVEKKSLRSTRLYGSSIVGLEQWKPCLTLSHFMLWPHPDFTRCGLLPLPWKNRCTTRQGLTHAYSVSYNKVNKPSQPWPLHWKKRWMSVVMFYLVQLFLMPSATSDVLHDLESPSFINFVCLLNIAHAFWLTLNGIRLERVWSGPAVALRLSKTFHFRTPSKNLSTSL